MLRVPRLRSVVRVAIATEPAAVTTSMTSTAASFRYGFAYYSAAVLAAEPRVMHGVIAEITR